LRRQINQRPSSRCQALVLKIREICFFKPRFGAAFLFVENMATSASPEAESIARSRRCDGSLQRGIIRQLSSNNLSKAADSAAFFVVRTYERFARTG
jgi:hypothetical protein